MKWEIRKINTYEWHKWFAWYPATVEFGEVDEAGAVYGVSKKVWLKTVWRKEWVSLRDWGYYYKETEQLK